MVAVTPDAIRAARERIPAAFRDMPQFVVEALTERLGVPVVVKAETANPVGCFKGRGTWLAVAQLAAAGGVGEGSGLVVASAGNFGQGAAYAARAHRVPLVVFAAETANPAKLAAVRRLGAEVRLAGEDFDAARTAAAEHAAGTGWRLLVDGQDPWISVGAGTIALELTEGVAAGDLPPLTAVYVPVGNGALAGGIGRWLHGESPGVRVMGVVAEQAPAMALSWREKRPVETERADTVADGIAVRVPVPEALEVMLDAVDEVIEVSEQAILEAQRDLEAALPFTVEPSAAAAWAGVLAGPEPTGAVAWILTGGNTLRAA